MNTQVGFPSATGYRNLVSMVSTDLISLLVRARESYAFDPEVLEAPAGKGASRSGRKSIEQQDIQTLDYPGYFH